MMAIVCTVNSFPDLILLNPTCERGCSLRPDTATLAMPHTRSYTLLHAPTKQVNQRQPQRVYRHSHSTSTPQSLPQTLHLFSSSSSLSPSPPAAPSSSLLSSSCDLSSCDLSSCDLRPLASLIWALGSVYQQPSKPGVFSAACFFLASCSRLSLSCSLKQW